MAAKCRGTIPASRSTWKTFDSLYVASIWNQFSYSRFPHFLIVFNPTTNQYNWISTVVGTAIKFSSMQPPIAEYEFWQEGKCRGNQQCGKWAPLASRSSHLLKYRVNNSSTWTDTTFEQFFGSSTNSVGVMDKIPTGKFDFYAGVTSNCVHSSMTSSFKTIYKLPKAISFTMPSKSTAGEFSLPSSFYGAPFKIDYRICSNFIFCNPSTISIPSSNGLFPTTGTGWNVTPVAGFDVPGVNVVLTTDRKVRVTRTSTTIRNRVWKGILTCGIPGIIADPASYFKISLEIVF